MPDDILDPTSATLDNGAESPQPESTPDIAKLLNALQRERETRARLEKEVSEKTKAEKDYELKLKRYQQVDPEQYELLLREKTEREEQDLIRKQSFEELKERYRVDNENKVKEAESWRTRHDDLLKRTAIEKAFYETGGKRSTFDLDSSIEEIPPIEAVQQILLSRIRIEEGGRVVVLDRFGQAESNSEGKTKTLTEKMLELKKGSIGTLFEPAGSATGGGKVPTTVDSQGRSVKVFSRESARNGKASIDAIARGDAFVQ